jgi:non-ribosomal peptide synthetase component F
MYSSGSTGKLKGVQITHANISNYIQAIIQRTAPEPFGRVIVEAMLCGRPVVAA